jgi:hypothetical protein
LVVEASERGQQVASTKLSPEDVPSGTKVITSTGKHGVTVGSPYLAYCGDIYVRVSLPGRRGTTANKLSRLALDETCKHCGLPVFIRENGRVDLVNVEYAVTTTCFGRDPEGETFGHEVEA